MIFTPGLAVSQLSGSVGGTTASRNRYGQYFRNRAIPITSTTPEAMNAKARFGNISADWAGLTDAQREAWRQWAQTNPVINALGQPQILAGNAAYIQLNTILDFTGDTAISDPPIADPPESLTSLTLAADIGLGNVDVTYAPTPLGAAEKLLVWAAVVDSAGRRFVENLYKLCFVSAAAAASPQDIETEVTARFGTLSVGQVLFVKAQVLDTATGLRSLPRVDSATVVST